MFTQKLTEISNGNDVRNALIFIKEQLKATENIDKLKNTSGYETKLWLQLLNNEDAKVRKNTALIMGYLNEEGFEDALYEGYVKEGTLFVRSAYLEALFKCDYKKYEKELFNIKASYDLKVREGKSFFKIVSELKEASEKQMLSKVKDDDLANIIKNIFN